jgi:hypothetical protein
MQKLMRKRILMPVVALVALAVAGIAVAYFTATGTGSGTATVGTDSGVTITDVTFDSTLYPGGSTVVRFTINNPSSDTSVSVDEVVADTNAGTNGITGLPAGCEASDFTFADVTVDEAIAAGRSTTATGRLEMANTASNQDACKDASPVLNLVVDNSGI